MDGSPATNVTLSELQQLVFTAGSGLGRRMDQILPDFGLTEDRADVLKSMGSSQAGVRLGGVLRAIFAMAGGADPRAAALWGEALITLWFQNGLARLWGEADKATLILAFLVKNTAYAHLVTGNLDRCLALVDAWLPSEEARPHPDQTRAIALLKVEALIRRLRISEALALFDAIRQATGAGSPELDRIAPLVNAYKVRTRDPAAAFDYGDAIDRITSRDLPAIRQSIDDWRTTMTERYASVEKLVEVEAVFATFQSRIDALTSLAGRRDIPVEEHYDQLSRSCEELRLNAHQVLGGKAGGGALTVTGVDLLINRAGILESERAARPEEIGRTLEQLAKAEAWCAANGDLHAVLWIRWVTARLMAKRGDAPRDLLAAHRRVEDTIVSAWDLLESAKVRAVIASRFQRLGKYTSDLALDLNCPDVALASTELHRALGTPDPAPPPALPLTGARLAATSHYLGLTCFEEDDPLVATLMLGSGKVLAARLPITPVMVRSSTFDPAPLLQIVGDALAEGMVKAGDHLHIAADGPVQAVPFEDVAPPYADLTVVRVASLSDASLEGM